MKNIVSRRWSFWAVTLASAIALLSNTPQIAAQTNSPQSSQSEQFEAQKLEQQAWELEIQGKYSEAIPLVQRSLLLWEKALGAEHPTVAYSLNYLATLYKEQGNYNGAEPLYLRALAINEKVEGKDSPIVASILNNLAGLYQYQGNYSGAEPLLRRSLAIDEKKQGKEHPDVATVLNNLALLYQAQKNYAQAEPLLQHALAIREKGLKPENTLIASSLSNLAVVYGKQGKYNQAEPLLQRALTIVEKALNPDHPNIAFVLNNLAELYATQGKYSQAEPLLKRSLAIREKALGQNHPLVANSLNNFARLYQGQGNIARAVEFNHRSSNIEEHNLALILSTGSESRKRDYIATLTGSTNTTISLHIQSAPNNPQAARLALTTILRRKGRVLDALTDSLQALRNRLNPDDLLLLDALATTRSQLANLTFKGAENTPPEQFRNQIATLSAQEQQQEATISRRSAEFRTQNQPVTVEAVQKLIPADAVLVELVLYKPYRIKAAKESEVFGNPRYVAYILQSQGEPKSVDLGDAETINIAVTEFRHTIRTKIGSEIPFKKAARTLDAILMQPIRQQLGNQRHILLSPDSQLNLIPFAALIDENDRYLLEKYEINYLSSGRDLIKLQAKLSSKENPVIVANPQFDRPGNPPTVLVASNTRGKRLRTSPTLVTLRFGAIANTAQEAKVIATILPHAQLLTGSDATENAIKQLHAPNILHIATHGFFLEDAPAIQGEKAPIGDNPLLRSGLALAGFNLRKSGNEDGVLTALEVAGLDLVGTKLVVLSACETGLGDVANGEGVYGLRRALAIAGAESQLISLWVVDDFATKELMMSYYRRLQKNVGRSAALRQVQLEMLNNPQYHRPYYWATFIPSGEWAILNVKP
jgi:CHAT domain-containing protein/Flp pilus assembly protein TadD